MTEAVEEAEVAGASVWVPLLVAGTVVVGIGHQVVYLVTTSLTVTVAVETKAGETDSEQACSSQEVMVTKVVSSLWTVVVLVAATTAVTAAIAVAVENCIFGLVKRVTEDINL